MRQGNVVAIVLLAAVVIGMVIYFNTSREAKTKHSWERTLKTRESEPYDLSILYGTLQREYDTKFHEIDRESDLKRAWGSMRDDIEPGVYFFIGPRIYLSRGDIEILADYVHMGGTVFISSAAIPKELFESFPGLENHFVNSVFSDSMELRFRHPGIRDSFVFENRVKNVSKKDYWQYLDQNNPKPLRTDSLGNALHRNAVVISLMDSLYPDFMFTRSGRGRLFVHTNPVFFGNIYLQRDQGRKYLAAVMKHLPNRDIWFDQSSGSPKPDAVTGHTRRSIFSFVQQNNALLYSWWILITGVLLFLFIGSRRKHRAIPIIRQPENNALGLVDSLGYFYFTENKNVLVFQREWNQFLNFLRWHIRVNPENMDESGWNKIAEKAGISVSVVQDVFDHYNKYRIFTELSGDELIEMNGKLTKFYLEYYNKNGK